MAHRAPKNNDTVKFIDQQQAILNDAVEQLMRLNGLNTGPFQRSDEDRGTTLTNDFADCLKSKGWTW